MGFGLKGSWMIAAASLHEGVELLLTSNLPSKVLSNDEHLPNGHRRPTIIEKREEKRIIGTAVFVVEETRVFVSKIDQIHHPTEHSPCTNNTSLTGIDILPFLSFI